MYQSNSRSVNKQSIIYLLVILDQIVTNRVSSQFSGSIFAGQIIINLITTENRCYAVVGKLSLKNSYLQQYSIMSSSSNLIHINNIYIINFIMVRYFLLLLCLFSVATQDSEQYLIRFGEDQMLRKHHHHDVPNPTNITVHLIPHSHDDVGWLKTVDEYYYGDRQDIQWAAVQYVYDTMIAELTVHPEYRFVVVEMAFLYRWWNNAQDGQKQAMKKLVQNKQIQFINAGWCMSDQATTYYEDVIDQMTIGLRWLKQNFNYVPEIAWHIDPFGHQASTASMFSKMGMQALFFARIDYQDKQKRMAQKDLEMIWAPHTTVQDSTNYIFTHVNYYLYAAPPGFNFDLKWLNQPIKDDPTLEDYNIQNRSQQYVDYFKSMSTHYKSSTLMHTIGGDFQYANARQWFKNMDKLTNYINNKPQYGVKFIYSTPGQYVKKILSQGLTYQTKTDDFFPYADQQNAYWTGYFTSRPAFKGFVRDFGRWLQAVRTQIALAKIRGLSVIESMSQQIQNGLWGLQTSIGIMQHHDAVSGTEKQRVADDYIATAIRSINKFKDTYMKVVAELIKEEIGQSINKDQAYLNMFWNETSKQTGLLDHLNNNKTILVSLYNPASTQTRQIKISVPPHDLRIIDHKNQPVSGDIFCASPWDLTHCELIFNHNLPSSANAYVKVYKDDKNPTAKVVKLKELTLVESSKGFNLTSTAYLKVTKSSQIIDLVLGNSTESFSVSYNYYESYQGQGQKSGAYIFRPASQTPKKFSTTKKIHYAEGKQGLYLCFQGDHATNKIFFSKVPGYLETKGFEIESRIESIPISDKLGKQVTMNLKTNHNNNQTFFTDSNGLEQQERKINYRPTWPLVVNQPISGNYYPINSHIRFKDSETNRSIAVITDRSQGGSVLTNGEFELMVHRRLLNDDSRGVNQSLNEPEPSDSSKGLIQNVRHYVVFGDNYRKVQLQNDQKINIILMMSLKNSFEFYKPLDSPIVAPEGGKFYLRPFSDGSYLLRVQNFNKQPIQFDIPPSLKATDELTLSANQLKEDWLKRQYKWKTNSSIIDQNQSKSIIDQNQSKSYQLRQSGEQWLSWIMQLLGIGQNTNKAAKEINGIALNFLEIRTFKLMKANN